MGIESQGFSKACKLPLAQPSPGTRRRHERGHVRRPVASGDPDALEAVGLGGEHARGIVVARFNPRSQVRLAEDIQVAIDVARLHFFDATDGHAIWEEATVAA